ncbi:GNAT family N-acetyltransferase [Acidovorax sp. SUPP3334]|uniref:GNAT family N-acetyltransferase n=1 Tax=Acidovorax sp. SUPP3334 TaxID=2920881 RepID=UPI0023DE2BEA|nr:GNAT family N-acetyltransferase [Acidovorax sp. SUPP3334]GKT24572.1 GNAT family N-acetyltransferase [Acidovorax sp. SUPP3334]
MNHPTPPPPASRLRIEVLGTAHLHAYKALRDESLRCAPEAFTSDYATALQRPAESYGARFGDPATGQFFLGAFDAGGQLLGSIGCEREERLQQRHCATVVGMMVAPNAQRGGIGRQLVQTCVEHAERVAGLEQLVLTVTAANAHVVRLYERAGFHAWGRLQRAVVIDGIGHDKLHMVRWLPASPLFRAA